MQLFDQNPPMRRSRVNLRGIVLVLVTGLWGGGSPDACFAQGMRMGAAPHAMMAMPPMPHFAPMPMVHSGMAAPWSYHQGLPGYGHYGWAGTNGLSSMHQAQLQSLQRMQSMHFQNQAMNERARMQQIQRSFSAQPHRNLTSSSRVGHTRGADQTSLPGRSVASSHRGRPDIANPSPGVWAVPFGPDGVMDYPRFSYRFQEPEGTGERSQVRVVNPTRNAVAVELRAERRRKKQSFRVRAGGSHLVTVPNGSYQVYFRFANEPDAVYQGEDLRLSNQVAEIRLEAVRDGNYALRRVD